MSMLARTPNGLNSKHLGKGSTCPPLQPGVQRIYSMRFCPFAERALLVAFAKGFPLEIVNVNLTEKPEWLFEKSSGGKVPATESSSADGPITESLIIADYFDEIYPHRALHSKDPLQKAKDRVWMEQWSKVWTTYFRMIYTSMEQDALIEAFKELSEALAPYEKELARRGTNFFGGDAEPGMLDYMIWPWMERIPNLKLKFPTLFDFVAAKLENPNLEKWRQRMKEDSAVQAVYLSPEQHMKFVNSGSSYSRNYDILFE